jgi:hypothetical protein
MGEKAKASAIKLEKAYQKLLAGVSIKFFRPKMP